MSLPKNNRGIEAGFFLLVDKPVGITSHDVVSKIRRIFQTRRVGHHGTLDPFASGLMLIAVNEATKFLSYIADDFKTYVATMQLGEETDTLDGTGQIIQTKSVPAFSNDEFLAVCKSFLGESLQVPPMFSAKKIAGQKLCDVARRGEVVERPPQKIQVREIFCVDCCANTITFSCTVSRGTYVRVLAADMAEKLGTVAHLKDLRRTAGYGFEVTSARALDEIVADPNSCPKIFLHAIFPEPWHLFLESSQIDELYFGRPLLSSQISTLGNNERLPFQCLVGSEGFFGIGKIENGFLKPLRLIAKNLPLNLSEKS